MIPRVNISSIDWAGLGSLLAVGLAVYVSALILATVLRLCRPPRRGYAWAVARGRPGDPREACGAAYVDERRDLGGGTTPLWIIEGGRPDGPGVIITHGWGSSRVEMLDRLEPLRRAASRVVMWDMPGHGDAPGPCTLGHREPGMLAALIADEPSPVVLYGWSLGAEVSLIAAARAAPGRVAGLVLEGVYRRGWTPAAGVFDLLGAPRAVNLAPALAVIGLVFGGRPGRRWADLSRHAAGLRVPALVLHAADDRVCPVDDARGLAGSLHAQLVELEDAGHGDVWKAASSSATAAGAVTRFVEAIGPAAAGEDHAETFHRTPSRMTRR